MIKFDIVTIFPEIITPYAEASILGRAQKKKLIKITAHQLRDFSKDKHSKVDDTPYGGGAGMVMTVQPIADAVKKITSRCKSKKRIILTSASGKKFTQADAKRLAKYGRLVFICGRYEGIDARVEKEIADESFSIGDYVLTGGELPALVMTDAIARQVKGVLGSAESLAEESHDTEGLLEYPQYTKPEIYFPPFQGGIKGGSEIRRTKERIKGGGRKRKGWTVPKILLSGNHAAIKKWREEQSKKRSK